MENVPFCVQERLGHWEREPSDKHTAKNRYCCEAADEQREQREQRAERADEQMSRESRVSGVRNSHESPQNPEAQIHLI